MEKQFSRYLPHPLAHGDAAALRIKVTLILLLLLIGSSVLFIASYLVTRKFALIPYIVFPFLLPGTFFYFHLKLYQKYRTVLWFLIYFYTTLGLLKLTASPLYLVDWFLMPTYIGTSFLVLKYKHAVPMVVYLLSIYAVATGVVYWYQPFAILYTNDNISSLITGLIISIVGTVVIFFVFAKHYQRNSELLSDTLYTLSKVNDDNKLLINVVSHDFKNYLTRIVLMTSLYKSRTADAVYQEELDNIETAIFQLSDLIKDVQGVRDLSHDDTGLAATLLPFGEMMKKLELIFRHQMYEKQLVFNTERVRPLQLKVNPDIFIHIILSNLIGNAIKFSPPKNQIELSLDASDGAVVLTVANHATLDHLANLQKIARGQEVRASARGTLMEEGQGLGISILKKFCKVYGIDYTVAVAIPPGEHLCLVTSTLTWPEAGQEVT